MDEFEDEYQESQEQQQPQQQAQDNSVIRGLREKARKADEYEKELAQLKAEKAQRERADQFSEHVKALGIPDADQLKFQKLAERFIEGDPDEASLRGLATEYGFLTQEKQAQEEAQRMEQAAQMAQGGRPVLNTPSEISQRIKEAKTPEEVMALARQSGLPIKGE